MAAEQRTNPPDLRKIAALSSGAILGPNMAKLFHPSTVLFYSLTALPLWVLALIPVIYPVASHKSNIVSLYSRIAGTRKVC